MFSCCLTKHLPKSKFAESSRRAGFVLNLIIMYTKFKQKVPTNLQRGIDNTTHPYCIFSSLTKRHVLYDKKIRGNNKSNR